MRGVSSEDPFVADAASVDPLNDRVRVPVPVPVAVTPRPIVVDRSLCCSSLWRSGSFAAAETGAAKVVLPPRPDFDSGAGHDSSCCCCCPPSSFARFKGRSWPDTVVWLKMRDDDEDDDRGGRGR